MAPQRMAMSCDEGWLWRWRSRRQGRRCRAPGSTRAVGRRENLHTTASPDPTLHRATTHRHLIPPSSHRLTRQSRLQSNLWITGLTQSTTVERTEIRAMRRTNSKKSGKKADTSTTS
ncbi:hypothetical protein L1887_62520 [Cichorium endivia]|nr:hypothetical protein L1887_62520 [Cichorium endivia]